MSAGILTLPPLALRDVTLVAATSVALEATAAAVAKSLAQVRFGRVLWLSDKPPPESISAQAEWRKIPALQSRDDYSRFMLNELVDHIDSDHALIVQWDGYIINAAAWQPAFLDFDYIGAPWPQFHDAFQVGNGGFSLRSRRLLEACRTINARPGEGEDVTICRTNRAELEAAAGITIAPVALARQFSCERGCTDAQTFGFHGVFNLMKVLAKHDAYSLLASLEPHMLARREEHELLRWAVFNGRWRTAWKIAQRIRWGWSTTPA